MLMAGLVVWDYKDWCDGECGWHQLSLLLLLTTAPLHYAITTDTLHNPFNYDSLTQRYFKIFNLILFP